MRKIILASVAVLGFAGVAAAQEAPALLYGTQSQNISSWSAPQAGNATVVHQRAYGYDEGKSVTGGGFQINQNENYSGR